jgi:hypothetical protein
MNKKILAAVAAGMALVTAAALFISGKKEETKVESGEKTEAQEKEEPVLTITKEDADSLIAEKLKGGTVEFAYSHLATVDGNSYYLYNILSDELPTGESLAVDAVSGEVGVYSAGGEILPYSAFSGYDKKLDETIEWNGTYISDRYAILVEEQDPASFQYVVSALDGKERITAYAVKDSNIEATGSLDDKVMKFNLNDGELSFGGYEEATGYDGTYTRINETP